VLRGFLADTAITLFRIADVVHVQRALVKKRPPLARRPKGLIGQEPGPSRDWADNGTAIHVRFRVDASDLMAPLQISHCPFALKSMRILIRNS
jgi:hypothetical protein